MGKIILVTGGCRSGKSRYAQRSAESIEGRHVYVATCPVTDDDEMRDRIARHRRQRSRHDWETIEEPLDLADAIFQAGGTTLHADRITVVLVDCLTLWINNLMHEADKEGKKPSDQQNEKQGKTIEENDVERLCGQVLDACRRHEGTVFFVTNEVGMGIVPDNALARRYRDLVGRCNQVMAAGADEATLVACGIPLTLKGGNQRVAS